MWLLRVNLFALHSNIIHWQKVTTVEPEEDDDNDDDDDDDGGDLSKYNLSDEVLIKIKHWGNITSKPQA